MQMLDSHICKNPVAFNIFKLSVQRRKREKRWKVQEVQLKYVGITGPNASILEIVAWDQNYRCLGELRDIKRCWSHFCFVDTGSDGSVRRCDGSNIPLDRNPYSTLMLNQHLRNVGYNIANVVSTSRNVDSMLKTFNIRWICLTDVAIQHLFNI